MTFSQILCELGSMFSVLKVCKEYHMSLKYFFPKFAQKICTKRIIIIISVIEVCTKVTSVKIWDKNTSRTNIVLYA